MLAKFQNLSLLICKMMVITLCPDILAPRLNKTYSTYKTNQYEVTIRIMLCNSWNKSQSKGYMATKLWHYGKNQ